jgi:hypothetical protein
MQLVLIGFKSGVGDRAGRAPLRGNIALVRNRRSKMEVLFGAAGEASRGGVRAHYAASLITRGKSGKRFKRAGKLSDSKARK